MVLANLIGNRMSIFIFMNLVVNLYIVLLNCCTMLLNFLLIFAVKLCLILLVVNLYCTGVLYMLSLSWIMHVYTGRNMESRISFREIYWNLWMLSLSERQGETLPPPHYDLKDEFFDERRRVILRTGNLIQMKTLMMTPRMSKNPFVLM